jgi:hypothetical protein
LLLPLAIQISGCFTYRGALPSAPAQDLPYAARVTTTTGTVFRLEGLTLRGDTLVGTARDGRDRQHAIPLPEVALLEPLRFHALRTGLFLAVPLTIAYLIHQWIESTVIVL